MNDYFGHPLEVGDRVLYVTASRSSAWARPGSVKEIGTWGGRPAFSVDLDDRFASPPN